MKNFNLRSLLSAYPIAESAIHENSIRLVRHQMKDWSGFNSMLRFNKHVLKVFTAEQGNDIFSSHRLILVFVSMPGGRALLSGAFVNHGLISRDAFKLIQGYDEYTQYRKSIDLTEQSHAEFFYELQVCQELAELFDRLIIDWGGANISWYQNKIDKDICQIMAPGFVKIFPGWDEVNITHQELCAIIQNPDGNPDWAQFLKSHDGVYLILDNATGRQYVGSATGEQTGLWGRWAGYAKTGHNSNKLLEELLIERGDMHKRNFTFSLHHVFARGAATKKDVLFYESLLKKKLGSRAFGLNAN
jgi:hypothetical protein